LDDPLRPSTDIVGEGTLQVADAHGDLRNPSDAVVARNVAYHFRQQQRGFVSCWHVLQKEGSEHVGPADLVTLFLDP
jgi:hypothetical protein